METTAGDLPRIVELAGSIREVMLANIIMLGEIPAPSGAEEPRCALFAQRLSECGLQNCSVDEKGNAAGLIPGTDGQQTILVSAHADTADLDEEEYTISVSEQEISGPFLGDNCIGLGALLTLPHLLELAGIRLRSNVVLLAAARSVGRSNLEGHRFFLANSAMPVHYGLCVEGVQLGRLNYACMGVLRGEILCHLPDDYDWMQFGATGAIIPMSEIINRISQIPLPRRPLTVITMGSIRGGFSYDNVARQATLCFEARSESWQALQDLRLRLADATADVGAKSGVKVQMDILVEREPGGLEIGHPLVRAGRDILSGLGLQPQLYSTTAPMTAYVEKKIPALTIGITTAERRTNLDEFEEAAAIAPMSVGMAQFIGLLMAIDRGFDTV